MIGNLVIDVKNCSDKDALALTYYLYKLSQDIKDFEAHEEFQLLYDSLVDRLNLREHSELVVKAFTEKYKKAKRLTLAKTTEDHTHPFSLKGKLKTYYYEDDSIYENCGAWKTKKHFQIDLVRVIFSDNTNEFTKIIGLTFFEDPKTFKETFPKIPNTVVVPKNVKDALNDVSSVSFAIDTLKLSMEEARLLQIIFRMQGISELYAVCNDLYRNEERSRFDFYSKCLDTSVKNVRKLLKKDQKLMSFGLVTADGDMDSDAMDAIADKDMRLYFADIIKAHKNTSSYELSSFSIKKNKSDLAVQFLKSGSPCNILLYGAPGSGKTEYAKALIKAAGLKMTSYKNELEVDEEHPGKALGRLNCYLSLKKEDTILVVDEAESVLKTIEHSFFGTSSLASKGTVNRMLEQSENKVIWILNYTDELDESTLRRFTYSIKFHEMPKVTLRSIAESKFSKLRLPKSLMNQILDICTRFEVTGASIDNIVKVVKAMDYKNQNEEKILSDIKDVLEANSTLLYGNKKIRDTVGKSYDLSVLNTSTPASEVVEMVQNAMAIQSENPEDKQAIRMLFYGLSGTGKTELARYISQVLGKKLLLKRCSDLLSKWVGGTEQNIRNAFEEATETDSILLFDEADSFFANREGAQHSWERTQVNEFLTQMEEFQGIVICTTNLRKIMDPAMQRRFHIITEFKALNEEGIITLLNKYFEGYDFQKEDVKGLTRYDTVTPGDFGALKDRVKFVSKVKLCSEYILSELVAIQREKLANGAGHIGFAS